jgi:hypothetical protein
MRSKVMGLFAALALVGVSLFAASPAQATSWTVSHTGPDDGQAQNPFSHIRVKALTNDNGLSGGSIRVTAFQITVMDGCSHLYQTGYHDLVLVVKGSTGAVKYQMQNLDVGKSCGTVKTFVPPNVVIGESAYWHIEFGIISLLTGDLVFGDCWRIHPAQFTAPHPGCVYVNNA